MEKVGSSTNGVRESLHTPLEESNSLLNITLLNGSDNYETSEITRGKLGKTTAQEIIPRLKKLSCGKLKMFCTIKETIPKVKRIPIGEKAMTTTHPTGIN